MKTLLMVLALASLPALAGDRGIEPPPCVDRASCTQIPPQPGPDCWWTGSSWVCLPCPEPQPGQRANCYREEPVPIDNPATLALLAAGVAALAVQRLRK